MNRALLLCLVAISMIAACATREELIAKSATVPAGVELSGDWELRAADNDTMQRIRKAGRAADGSDGNILPSRKSRSQKSGKRKSGDTSVHVFLETGRALRISQTDHGLFISFDRAIVEEYRFGEEREVSVGPIAADRVSGWEGGAYVIETLDQEGAKLIESYRLDERTDTLVRLIRIVYKDEEQLSIEQVFDRA